MTKIGRSSGRSSLARRAGIKGKRGRDLDMLCMTLNMNWTEARGKGMPCEEVVLRYVSAIADTLGIGTRSFSSHGVQMREPLSL